jgi:hypothetical protein
VPDFLSDLLLRITTRPGIAAKGSELDYEEMDRNIYAMAEFLHDLAYAFVAGLPAYDSATIYTGGETVYVSYGNLAWEFVSETNRSGVTPGTNDAVWLKAPISKFAHAQDSSGGSVSFPNVIAQTVGGFLAGQTPGTMSNQAAWTKLVYPYQAPSFSPLASAIIKTYEVGEPMPSGIQNVVYAIANSAQLKAQPPNVGVPTTNITGATFPVNPILLAGSGNFNVNIPGPSATPPTPPIKLTARGNLTISLQGTNSNNGTFSVTTTIPWKWKKHIGNSALATLDSDALTALNDAGSDVEDDIAGDYVFEAGGYKYITHQEDLGTLTIFKAKDTGFAVPMEPVVILSVTTAFSVTTNYKIYRTSLPSAGALTIVAS